MDPYHIMETKGKLRGSLWLGRKGLRWTLGEMGNLKHISSTNTGIFKFLRDGYRTLELSCLSNHGGRYVELLEYHGGAHRGNLRIPEGWCGAGWTLFESALMKYFLTKLEFGVSEQTGVGTAGSTSVVELGHRTGSNGYNSKYKTNKEKWKSWEGEDTTAKISHRKS